MAKNNKIKTPKNTLQSSSSVIDASSHSIKKLIKKGKENNILTYEEINKSIPEGTVSAENMEEF